MKHQRYNINYSDVKPSCKTGRLLLCHNGAGLPYVTQKKRNAYTVNVCEWGDLVGTGSIS